MYGTTLDLRRVCFNIFLFNWFQTKKSLDSSTSKGRREFESNMQPKQVPQTHLEVLCESVFEFSGLGNFSPQRRTVSQIQTILSVSYTILFLTAANFRVFIRSFRCRQNKYESSCQKRPTKNYPRRWKKKVGMAANKKENVFCWPCSPP